MEGTQEGREEGNEPGRKGGRDEGREGCQGEGRIRSSSPMVISREQGSEAVVISGEESGKQ